MKPLIGVTCSWDDEKGGIYLGGMYIEAIRAAGGIPLPLAYTGDQDSLAGITGVISGLVLSGGVDVDPGYFGEDPAPGCGEICPDRDTFEIDLARAALAGNLPVLGICRGTQVLNIAAGGDIHQDLGGRPGGQAVKHCQEAPRWHPTHRIEILEGTVMASILGAGPLRVNSFHHQAIRKVAPGFVVSARSADGVVEAVEPQAGHFALGVQFHPETMWQRHPVFLRLFTALVASAGEKAGSK